MKPSWVGLCCLFMTSPGVAETVRFQRGDANGDGIINLSDAVSTLGFLFLGKATPSCLDAADANDDGLVDISDALATLGFLFLGGTEIPLPGPDTCGTDPTTDELSCDAYDPCDDMQSARILEVTVRGSPGSYTFSVRIESPDEGCDQYADWWEVITPEGRLLYRRILAHSHTNEQPFTRSGGPVIVEGDTDVIVRAHMNTAGYGTQVFRGSPNGGFESVLLEAGFAAELAEEAPLPEGCAF